MKITKILYHENSEIYSMFKGEGLNDEPKATYNHSCDVVWSHSIEFTYTGSQKAWLHVKI